METDRILRSHSFICFRGLRSLAGNCKRHRLRPESYEAVVFCAHDLEGGLTLEKLLVRVMEKIASSGYIHNKSDKLTPIVAARSTIW